MPDEVVIVGTAHVSERSAAEVRDAVRDEDPDIVAVELDPRRYEKVRQQDDTTYGGDMAAAVNEAEARGVPVALIDRELSVTLRRFWDELSMFERVKTAGAVVAAFLGIGGVSVDEIDRAIEEDRVDGYVDELREFSPGGARVIIDERDAYMASRLLELDGKVVAVVGAGHEDGVRRYLENPDEIPDVPGDGYETTADTDIYESANEVLVLVDLPGFEKDDVSVSLTGKRLEVEASGRNEFAQKYRFVGERRADGVEASVHLPARVDPQDTEATYEEGVVRVRLGKV
ncbi:MAG: TraB/GumN family protein [Halobacteriales archaeon]